MSGGKRIAIVFIVVVLYNYFNQPLFNVEEDLTLLNVAVTSVIAMIVYTVLVFLYKSKKKRQ